MKRRGIVLYHTMGLLAVLSILASMLVFLGRREEYDARNIYYSEVITNLAEAATEEIFYNIEQQLNVRAPGNRIYDQVRVSSAKEIEIDPGYLKEISANARKIAEEDYGIPEEDFVVKGRIVNIEPFKIPGFDEPPDPIEKNAAFRVEITITYGAPGSKASPLTKVIVVTRPFKVVRTTVPVLSECTLFVNNLSADYFATKESVLGYDPKKFPEAQKTLVLDNGWAGYQKSNKKSDFINFLENDVIRRGKVPPGRVFINKGIVPLTNGDRSSGALQKTFYSAESELLPSQVQIPLKALRKVLEQKFDEARQAALESYRTQGLTTEEIQLVEEGGAGSAGAGSAVTSSAIPEDGDILFRYIGHGRELMDQDDRLKESLGGRKVSGYYTYFQGLANGEWQDGRRPSPALSGLDLYGNVVEKEKGKAIEGEGFWGRIWGKIKKFTSDLLEKLYSKYQIRISPTLVYGDVVQTYFMVRDYAESGWLQKMKNTLSFQPNQFPLPYFPTGFFDGADPETPIDKKRDLPDTWDDKLKEKWLKLPEALRKPSFYITLNETILAQQTYGLGPEFLSQIPAGAIFSPYNQALLEFLIPEAESPIRQRFNQLGEKGYFFLKNELDRKFFPQAATFKEYAKPLAEFNPFLFYVKATDYIASLYDPRNPKVNVFYAKYYDQPQKMFDINGLVYITGTEDLVFANNKYRGKGIIITFGRVVFKGFMVKHEDYDAPDDPARNANLTIIALGGIQIDTSERIDAQLYSYIYPMEVTPGNTLNLYGSLGCNFLDMSRIADGGRIVFDYTYHIPPDMQPLERDPYYHVNITNEILKYEYDIRRESSILMPTN